MRGFNSVDEHRLSTMDEKYFTENIILRNKEEATIDALDDTGRNDEEEKTEKNSFLSFFASHWCAYRWYYYFDCCKYVMLSERFFVFLKSRFKHF